MSVPSDSMTTTLKPHERAANRAVPWATALALAGLALGLALRLKHYLDARSFWLDELMLAQNVMDRGLAGLLEPLDYMQGAPLGFLVMSKLVGEAFGYGEYALRLLPVLFGTGALIVSYFWLRRGFGPVVAALAVLVFAMSGPAIYHSAEFKPYSGDLFAAAGILGMAAYYLEAPRRRLLVGLAVAGAVAVWFSYAVPFVLATVGGVLMLDALGRRDYRDGAALIGIGALWLSSFAVMAVVTGLFSPDTASDIKDMSWAEYLAPFPPTNGTEINWYQRRLVELFNIGIGLKFAGLAILLTVAGIMALWTQGRRLHLLLLIGPLGVMWVASVLKQYPMYGRFELFLVPGMVALMALGLDRLRHDLPDRLKPLWVLAAVLLVANPAWDAVKEFGRKPAFAREELRPLIARLAQSKAPDDGVYLYYGAVPGFWFYGPQYGLDPKQAMVGRAPRLDWNFMADDARSLIGKGRVWVVMSHNDERFGTNEERLLTFLLGHAGRQLETHQQPGASLYLYDFGTTPADTLPVTPELERPYVPPHPGFAARS